MSYSSPEFWIALLQIIGVNIVLSGDNAVVIALAARGLPAGAAEEGGRLGQRRGGGDAHRADHRRGRTAAPALPQARRRRPAALDRGAAAGARGARARAKAHATSRHMAAAIKTILIADLVMSLDNVIAVAAAAKGSTVLLIVGLAISIPLVVFASTLLLKLMERFPIIITLGAALLGWVAGEMAITDPAVKAWVDAQCGAACTTWRRRWARSAWSSSASGWPRRAEAQAAPARCRRRAGACGRAVCSACCWPSTVPGAAQAVQQLIAMRSDLREPAAMDLHLVNVQRPVPGDVSELRRQRDARGLPPGAQRAALAPARAALDAAGLQHQEHQRVGDPGTTIAALARSWAAT